MGFLTVDQLLVNLQQRGFVFALEYVPRGLSSPDTDQQWTLEEYQVIECYHYRKVDTPAGSIVILAIETRTGHKGILIDACGEVSALDRFLPSSPLQVALEH